MAILGKDSSSHYSDSAAPIDELGDQKRKILWHLKTVGEAGLEDLSKFLKISRMAVHKHLVALEERGLVESSDSRRGRVGRPRALYKLSERSRSVFPKSYSAVALCALKFIENNIGRAGVEQALRERQSEIFEKYYPELKGLDLDGKVKLLAKLRDDEGYMAESRKLPSGKYLILEHNCPIIQLAQNFWEACSTETELFENLIGAKVETTHRAAKGDLVCRFLIDPKKRSGGSSREASDDDPFPLESKSNSD
jgi:predicted ArsR family transcriptional regulator